jgi:spermidine synthase
MAPKGGRLLLALSMFVMGGCGIIYEYVLSVLGNNLIGSRYEEILIIIGIMLFAMGMGSVLQERLREHLIDRFLLLQVALGFVGGIAPLGVYAVYTVSESFHVVLYGAALAIGGLIGMEIPILIRINKEYVPELRVNLSNILSLDYIGSLAGSLVFVFVLLTTVSLGRIGFILGLTNTAIAVIGLVVFRAQVQRPRLVTYTAALSALVLGFGCFLADDWSKVIEQRYYKIPIVFSQTSQYQHILLLKRGAELRLYLNQHTQFVSTDEVVYHEMLVHPALALAPSRKRVLILGGGDGLALREVLKYPDVESVTLVDIDPAMIRMAASQPDMVRLNQGSIKNARVTTVIPDVAPASLKTEQLRAASERRTSWKQESAEPVAEVEVAVLDADRYLAKVDDTFDVAILDFPDANRIEISKLFSRDFYTELRQRLSDRAVVAVQSSSVSNAKLMFLCIGETLRAARFAVVPYSATVPSFEGLWGFHLASPHGTSAELLAAMRSLSQIPAPTRYATPELIAASTVFGKGMLDSDTPIEPNSKMNPVLVRYSRASWNR